MNKVANTNGTGKLSGMRGSLPAVNTRPHDARQGVGQNKIGASYASHCVILHDSGSPLPAITHFHPMSLPLKSADQPIAKAGEPGFSQREFRTSLGMFATGVTIVTARTLSGELVGLTANSFNSVSLSPPLVLWSLSQAASAMAALSKVSHYAINVLAADQKSLAERFAGRREERWKDVLFVDSPGGLPLLDGAAATFECFNRSRHEEGDHVIFVGEVERCQHRVGASPLLYHGGKFYTEHPL